MSKIAWAVTCLVVWAGVSQVSEGVRLENGRYEDVVLAVDPAMGTDVIPVADLENKVKTLLQATSDSLHAATEGKLSLGSVRVVLPPTWNTPDDLLGEPAEGVSWGSADIRLEEPEKDFRGNYLPHTPHTLQPGQCGVPGRHITIHTTLLDNEYAEANYGSQGAVMAHEWAHYRWGVMQEHGFPGDDIFPVHYSRGGQDKLPTSCFDGDLEGNYLTEEGVACDPRAPSPECYFVPSVHSTNGSLMYLTHLSDGHFCTRDTHNPWAPTPQNIHCGRRSVWEVLETHDDFKQTSGPHANPAQVAVTFHKPQTPRIFLLFDPPILEVSEDIISAMVKYKIQDLSRKYQSFDVGMATCKLVGGNLELIKKRDFSPVNDVDSLDQFLPAVSDRETDNTVPLGQAVAQLVPTWTDYTPGTLLMALVYNRVTGEEAAAVDSEMLLKKKVKMLLLDGLGRLENLANMAPLLQETGGRIYSSWNETANMINLQDDFDKYFSSPHFDDHIVYGVSTTEIRSGSIPTTVGEIQLSGQGLSYLNLVVKIDSFDPEKFNVILRHPIIFKDVTCGSEDALKINLFCEKFDGGIYVSYQTTGVASSDIVYQFKVSSTSQQTHTATLTWSTVEKDVSDPMVYVDLWSSEDRDIKADIPESAGLMLFCEVAHPQGYLEELTISAEVVVKFSTTVETLVVDFVDEKLGEIDTRQSDSIWTAIVPGDYPAGSELTVTKLAINHNPDVYSPLFTGNTVESKREAAAPAGGSAAPSGSPALPINPWEGSCCGSYHDGSPFKELPINRFLRLPYKTVLARDVKESPPKVVGLEPEENSEQQVEGDIVKVAFKWRGAPETRRARSNPDSYVIRYSTDLYSLIDDFQNAKEPLEGTGTASGSATETVVSLPYVELMNQEVYLSIAAVKNTVMGPPATATPVTIREKTTTTTVTTTTVTTTSTTTTPPPSTTTTTPEPTTSTTEGQTGEPTTTPPPTTTDSASARNTLCQFLLSVVVVAFLTLR